MADHGTKARYTKTKYAPGCRCKPCTAANAAYYREYSKRNPGYAAAASRKRYKRRRQLIDRLKAVPCMDCHEYYPPYVMDFDHRPDTVKEFGIGEKIATYSEKRILEEAEKCDCANCHRMRTFARLKAQQANN